MRLAVVALLFSTVSLPTCGVSKTDTPAEESKTTAQTAKGLIPWKGTTGEREAALAARTKAFLEEKKRFEQVFDDFEKQRAAFYEERREALNALQEKKELIRREKALEERHKRLDLQTVLVAIGVAFFVVVSWVAFYFILAGPLGRKIAATVNERVESKRQS